MLTQDQLREALHEALKAADPQCGRFCVAGAEILDGERYHLFHNGTGSTTTDDVVIYAPLVLGMVPSKFTDHLKPWLTGLHTGKCRVDLNTVVA